MRMSEGMEFLGFAKASQLMATDRSRLVLTEQFGKSLGHQEQMAGGAADRLDAADQVHVGADDREIEPAAGADIAVANLAVVQGDAGVELGIGCCEPIEAVQCAESALQGCSTGRGRLLAMKEGEHHVHAAQLALDVLYQTKWSVRRPATVGR